MNGPVLWITGLPGSGKSTVAEELKDLLPDLVILRMDELRRFVTPEPTYADQERDLVYRALVYTAKTLSDLGHGVVIDATGNRRRWRDLARAVLPRFAEVYVRCPLAICVEREKTRRETHGAPRDIFMKAEAGWPVPGISTPYEEPLDPEITIASDEMSPTAAAAVIRDFIERRSDG
jgi:adenylylsulfate kinase